LQAKELTGLFRRYCPDGRIIFVMNELNDRTAADADLFAPESEGPDAIVRVLTADLQTRAA
jgi:hypothetical protein